MAFQLLRAHLTAFETQNAVTPYYKQSIQLIISSVAADVSWDIGTYSGTFWTAALADATYGAVARKIRDVLFGLASNAAYAFAPAGNSTLYRVRAKTATDNGDYEITSWTGKLPNITFAAASGPGSTNLIFDFGMTPGFVPMSGDILP